MDADVIWYIARDDRQFGPYSFEALQTAVRKGILSEDDLAWRSGFAQWKPLKDIAGLLPPSAEPPEPPQARDADPTSVAHDTWPQPAATDPLQTEPEQPGIATDAADAAASPAAAPPGKVGYIRRHWRGGFSLGYSYWVNGPLVTILLTIVILILAEGVRAHTGSSSWLIGLSACLFALPFVTVWQLVGIWRSASQHTGRGGRRGWAIVAKVAVVFGVLRSIADLGQGLPVAAEYLTMALGDKYGPPSFRLVRNGTELEFKGGIGSGLHVEFEKHLQASPNLRVVHLTSQGGRISEAELIAKEVKRRNLVTYVSAYCMSACTEIFVVGRQRWASSAAKIGFHSPSFPGTREGDLRSARADMISYLIAQGIDRSFAEKAIAVQSSAIWYPTMKEMVDAKVLTGIAEPDRFAASALGIFASVESARDALEQIPVFAAIRDVYPAEYAVLVKQAIDGYAGGQSEQEILGKGKQLVGTLVARSLVVAPADVVNRQGKLTLTYLQKLNDIDAESCVAYTNPGKGAKPRINLAQRFPDLSKEELALNAAIVQSAVGSKIARPTRQEVTSDLAGVFARLRGTYGSKVALVDAAAVPPADFATFCRINIDFYKHILNMQLESGARVLRYIYSGT
jgi:GYF domain 2